MDTINYFVEQIKHGLTVEVLDLALTREANSTFRLPVRLETLIEKLILPRLLQDFNLLKGVNVTIDINTCIVVANDKNFTMLRIPDSELGGRSLTSVYFTSSSEYGYQDIVTPLNTFEGLNLQYENKTMGTYDNDAHINIEVVSNNEFIVNASYLNLTGTLDCTVSYGERLPEINNRYKFALSKLAVLVAKAYVYNKLIVKLGTGAIYYGQELPIIQAIVEGYADANEEYMEMMPTLGNKLLFMNDSYSMSNFLNQITVGK